MMTYAKERLSVVSKDLYPVGSESADPEDLQMTGSAPTAEEIAAEVIRQQEEKEAAENELTPEEQAELDEQEASEEELAEMQVESLYVIAETLPAIEWCLIFIICLMVGGFLHKLLYGWFERHTI